MGRTVNGTALGIASKFLFYYQANLSEYQASFLS